MSTFQLLLPAIKCFKVYFCIYNTFLLLRSLQSFCKCFHLNKEEELQRIAKNCKELPRIIIIAELKCWLSKVWKTGIRNKEKLFVWFSVLFFNVIFCPAFYLYRLNKFFRHLWLFIKLNSRNTNLFVLNVDSLTQTYIRTFYRRFSTLCYFQRNNHK